MVDLSDPLIDLLPRKILKTNICWWEFMKAYEKILKTELLYALVYQFYFTF